MSILRRRKNESISIGNDIRTTIVECTADGVRLAIDVPRQVFIIREKLSEVERVNEYAMSPNATSIRSPHAAFKQYIFKSGDKESP